VARQRPEELRGDLTQTVASTKTVVAALEDNASASTITVAVLALAPQVKGLATSAQTTISTLKDSKDALSSAFQNADSCQSLGNDS